MVLNKRWPVPALLGAAARTDARYRRGELGRLLENVRRYSAPSAGLYDALAAPILGNFFTRVARDLGALDPRASVLEVGSGAGRLAVALATLAPERRISGLGPITLASRADLRRAPPGSATVVRADPYERVHGRRSATAHTMTIQPMHGTR